MFVVPSRRPRETRPQNYRHSKLVKSSRPVCTQIGLITLVGETAHHNKMTNMAMRLPNGNKATNASENMEVFGPHFHNVFNNHRPTDPTVLENVP